MVETNICREVKLHCNNCQKELSIADQGHYGEEVCKVCECGFSDSDEIECIEYESDKEGHAHKECWEEELKKDKTTAPIPMERLKTAQKEAYAKGQADLIDKLTSDDAVRAGFEFFCNEKTDKDMTLEESSMWCVREIIKAAIKKASESLGADAETTAPCKESITSVRPKPEKPCKHCEKTYSEHTFIDGIPCCQINYQSASTQGKRYEPKERKKEASK